MKRHPQPFIDTITYANTQPLNNIISGLPLYNRWLLTCSICQRLFAARRTINGHKIIKRIKEALPHRCRRDRRINTEVYE